MFERLKKKNANKIQDNKFGDKNYQMKDNYDANILIVSRLARVSNEITKYGPILQITEQKYIFEPIIINNETKYREVFTGFIAGNEEENFMLPFVIEPELFINYIPETKDKKLPKLSLLWILNDINHQKKNNHKIRKLKK